MQFQVNHPEVIAEYFDDEYVVVNLKTGTYYSLNLTGAQLWDAIQAGQTLDEMSEQFRRTFHLDPETAGEHIGRLLRELSDEQLIRAADPQAAPRPQTPAAPAIENAPTHAFEPPALEKYTDMQALLLLDPIHQVDDTGWPAQKPDAR